MQYKSMFYKDNQPLSDIFFDDTDAAAAVAFWIQRAVLSFNYHENVSPSHDGLNQALTSLMSDVRKSKALYAAFVEHGTDIFSQGGNITSLFNALARFGKRVGIDVVIKAIEPKIVPTLGSLAANTLIKHKHEYKDRITGLPSSLFTSYPNLHTDPKDYIKTRLYLFLNAGLHPCLEEKVIFQLILLLENPNKNLHRDIHGLLNKMDYKNTFPADLRVNLSAPLVKLMNRLHRAEITVKEFEVGVQRMISEYKPVSAASIFLSRLRKIYFDDHDLAKNLHTLLNDKQHKLSETFTKSIRAPLIQIIKDYNEFVLDLKRNEESTAATAKMNMIGQ